MSLKLYLLLALLFLCYIRCSAYYNFTSIYPHKISKSYFKPQTWFRTIFLNRTDIWLNIICTILLIISFLSVKIRLVLFWWHKLLNALFNRILNLFWLCCNFVRKQDSSWISVTYYNTWTYIVKNILKDLIWR